MKTRNIIIGLIVIACVGAGSFVFFKWRHGRDSAPDEAKTTESTVVTVQVGALKRMTLRHYVTAYAMVEPAPASGSEPAAAAHLAPTVAGVVARLNVVEGQHVEKGDVLVELNSSGATLNYAEEELARQRKLYSEHDTSLRNLQNAEAQLAVLRVNAPLSGTVTQVNVTPGAAVDATTVLAEVVDLTRLTLRFGIPASEAGELERGEEVQTLTDPQVLGTLSYIRPTVDTNEGTVLARAQLPADASLRPGQFVQARVVTGTHTNCLVAPAESVVTDIDGHSVIAVVNGDEATQSTVKTGYRENGWVEVENTGLKAGDPVVTVGAYGLPDKTKIAVANPAKTDASQTNSAAPP